MKKNILVFGLISGLIVTAMMIYATVSLQNNANFKANALLGYASMIVAFAFVFVGIKNARDKYNGGYISFGKAFRTGLYITLIASSMYVIAWVIEYKAFFPDFMEKYAECTLRDMRADGATEAAISKQVVQNAEFAALYKNPIVMILITYAEILPVGLVITVISALILKRKKPAVATV
jgi:hypothetical protein